MTEARGTTLGDRAIAEGAIILLIGAWWWAARGLPEFVLPGPLLVARDVARLLTEPALLYHAAVSFARVAGGVLAAMALAVALAVMARGSALFAAVLEHRVLLILNSFPSVGWAILGVIWFGVSDLTVIFIETLIVLPFCLINALAGFRQIDADLVELGRSLSRNRWRRFAKVTLPLVMPFLAAGLRVAFGIGWKIALVAELFGAQSGLGYVLMRAQSTADASMVFACCFVIVLIVTVVDLVVLRPLARRYSINQGERT